MKKFLHLGAGPIHLRSSTVEWINVDIEPSHNCDITMDYLKMVDVFGENSVSAVYSCHSIEHLPYPNGVVKFFEEVRKVLEPGGVLRVVVPDLMKVARDYVSGSDMKHIYDGPYFAYKDCPAERFTFFMRGWQHSLVFDEHLLRELGFDAGFSQFSVMPFGKSNIPELCNVDRFETESICVQYVK